MKPNSPLSRRDFLKLASLTPLTWYAKPLLDLPEQKPGELAPNVILLVFDAWSANHLQFYGYPRQTMPNLEGFLDRATVFHNHSSAGTFTVPGTASLLTGMYPWTHRALSLGSGGIIDSQQDRQAFALFADTHSTLAYAQNKYADVLLQQCSPYIDTHVRTGEFGLEDHFYYNRKLFKNDPTLAFASSENNVLSDDLKNPSSLFLNPLFRLWKRSQAHANLRQYRNEYPIGLPDNSEQFRLSDVVDGAIRTLQSLEEPGFVYFHFYPPHDKYRPLKEFYNHFDDGWKPPNKPEHRLSWGNLSYSKMNKLNQRYDEYIASWDAEVSRLFQFLQDSGLSDRSYVILTADHGEMNERAEWGHFTAMIFDPVIHIPLIVFQPGQVKRKDVHAYTSSVDVLPTLAHLAGLPVPDWSEGRLLPSLGGDEDPERGIYSMDAKSNPAFAPLTKTSLALTKYGHRLIYYHYPDDDQFEFYNLEEDPEELRDLYPSKPALVKRMKEELLEKLDEVNRELIAG